MIIQNPPLVNQAALAAARINGTAHVAPRPVADTPVHTGVPIHDIPQQPSPAELKNAVETLNKVMQQSNQNLEFSVDADTDKVVVRMVDTSTGQLIRQFPSEETLAISRGIEEFQQGMLLKQKA